GSRCACARPASPAGRALDGARLLVFAERTQRPLALLLGLAPPLAAEAEALEPRDLLFAVQARGIVGRQRADQRADAVAQLQREVRRRGAHQLAHVVDADGAVGSEALGLLGFGHARNPTTNPARFGSRAARRCATARRRRWPSRRP